MRRDAAYLGHPRVTFPMQGKVVVQSIGSGVKVTMEATSIQGWDLEVAQKADHKHYFNTQSLLEVWIEAYGKKVFGFAKFLQDTQANHLILRIIEIDAENQGSLETMLKQSSVPA